MIIQTLNLISGFALSGSVLGGINGLRETVTKAEHALSPYKKTLGIVVFVLGILQILDRLDFLQLYFLTGGFPQAFFAVAMGVLLAGTGLKMIPGVAKLHAFLWPYRQGIGIVGMLIGLSALL